MTTVVKRLDQDVELVLRAGLPGVGHECHLRGVPSFAGRRAPEVVQGAGAARVDRLHAADRPRRAHLLAHKLHAVATMRALAMAMLRVPDAARLAAGVLAVGAGPPHVADLLLVVAAAAATVPERLRVKREVGVLRLRPILCLGAPQLQCAEGAGLIAGTCSALVIHSKCLQWLHLRVRRHCQWGAAQKQQPDGADPGSHCR
mmetsp:Transcript_95371/g.253395  ORF Transcript_95371/g.253395 Transcript_95371/m.253395 type:complete len:202 (+) Transcript_95371:362-967(+)